MNIATIRAVYAPWILFSKGIVHVKTHVSIRERNQREISLGQLASLINDAIKVEIPHPLGDSCCNFFLLIAISPNIAL